MASTQKRRPRDKNRLTVEELELYWNDELDLGDDEESEVNVSDEENDIIYEDPKDGVDSEEETIQPGRPVCSSERDEPSHVHATFISKDGTQWQKQPVQKRKTLSKNIIRRQPGSLTQYSADISSIEEVFMLFITKNMIDEIVSQTNKKAENMYAEWNTLHPENSKNWTRTSNSEIRAYIGILITQGALHAAKEPVTMLWTTNKAYCRPVFPACFSRTRFWQLTTFLRFDDFETRLERRANDKLAPIRNIFDQFVENCKKGMNPGTHVTVDEQLVPFRGKAPFRVYMKSKPDRYGLKIWALADTTNAYIHNLQVYLGKEGNVSERNQGERVVLDMVSHLESGYGITTDNFFTSTSLADKLAEKNLTLCGTVRKNKRFVPPVLLDTKNRKEFSSIFAFTKKYTMVSYVPKKNRSVLLLSTEHEDDSIAGEENAYKPHIILHYNSTKGAVDTTDKLAKQYSVIRASRRWPMVIFGHVIDIAGINSFLIWKKKYPDKCKGHAARRIFLLDLGKELMRDHVQQRSQQQRLPAFIKECMEKVFPDIKIPTDPGVSGPHDQSSGRCAFCERNKDRKSRTKCRNCGKFVCSVHSQKHVVCRNCDV